ncbi:sulfurtransferase-like selenium metabolism protein YedF [Bacillota bacterium LX-D]|nr:sulfurtransferase-like selenium metabolism protein YedF [Bacillota bacterium LX-D]
MEKQVDVRGMSCPQPVIMTKKALENLEQGKIVTIVDNEVAKDNVVRLAESMHCQVKVENKGTEYYVHINKKPQQGMETGLTIEGGALYLVSSDKLGQGDDELGQILMRSFFYSLAESECAPVRVIFLNSGVKLACEGSEILSELIALEKKGVEILACGTCLDFYHLKEKLCIGKVTNMYNIVGQLNLAVKVISL